MDSHDTRPRVAWIAVAVFLAFLAVVLLSHLSEFAGLWQPLAIIAVLYSALWFTRGILGRLAALRAAVPLLATVYTGPHRQPAGQVQVWLAFSDRSEPATVLAWQRVRGHRLLAVEGPFEVLVHGDVRRHRRCVAELANGARFMPIGWLRHRRPSGAQRVYGAPSPGDDVTGFDRKGTYWTLIGAAAVFGVLGAIATGQSGSFSAIAQGVVGVIAAGVNLMAIRTVEA